MRFSILLATALSAAALALPAEGPQPDSLETRTEYYTHCQVVASALKYRTCPSTSCTAVGEYPDGKILDVVKTPLDDIPYVLLLLLLCRPSFDSFRLTTVYSLWQKLKNGYYVYSYYCLPV